MANSTVPEGSKLNVSQARRWTLEPLDSITVEGLFDACRTYVIDRNWVSPPQGVG